MNQRWPMVRLGDCCSVISGATPKTEMKEYWGGQIKWVTPKDISKLDQPYLFETPDKITELGLRSCSTTLLPKGAILLSSRAPIGNVAICGDVMCTNQGFKSLVPGSNVDSLYLYFCMLQNSRRLADLGNGATFKEVSKKIVENFEIPLPPLDEQKRIAAILDKADSLRRKRQQALQLADDFLRATFLDLFGDPVTNPKGWPELPVSDIAKVTTGNTPSREVAEYFGGEIEWIKSDNINTPEHWLTAAQEGLSKSGLAVGRAVPAGSILMTCIAGSPSCIGNVAMANRRVAFNQQINALTPLHDTKPEFLYSLLLYSKTRIQSASTNSMKGMISKGALERIQLISPPKSLQDRYVDVFNGALKLTEKMSSFKGLPLSESLHMQLIAN